MNPWLKAEFELEDRLDKIIEVYNKTKNPEYEQAGSCLLNILVLCQDIADLPTKEMQQIFWDSVQNEVKEILDSTDEFLSPK
jgi:hypothetical protein